MFMKIKDIIYELLETFLTSLVVILTLYVFIASVETVWGASMEPNFYTGERILVDKVTKRIKEFDRGDIVVLYPPDSDSMHYIKRIVGVPGDITKIFECHVYVSRDGNKFELMEPYLPQNTCTRDGLKIKEGRAFRIESGYYLVLGDNRNVSADSRSFGLVKKDRIIGKVIFRFWPISKAGFIN